jgi:hypothetical protein
LRELGPALLDGHGNVSHIGKQVKIVHLIVFLDDILNNSVMMSVKSKVMIEKDVESENDWLLDIPLLKRNSSVNFIH